MLNLEINSNLLIYIDIIQDFCTQLINYIVFKQIIFFWTTFIFIIELLVL
jgi:hypothetical protein